MDAESFLKILANSNVEKRLNEIFKPVITLTIDEALKPTTQQLNTKLNDIATTVNLLKADVASRAKCIETLQLANEDLSTRLVKAEAKIKELEAYSRRDNLLITGLAPTVAELAAAHDSDVQAESSTTTEAKVVAFCSQHLGVAITAEDISTTQYTKPKKATDPKQVVVRFVRRAKRDEVFYARGKLRTTNTTIEPAKRFYVNEDLADGTRKLFGMARTKLKERLLTSVWTSSGRVHVRDKGGHYQVITSVAKLNEITRAN